MKTRWVSVIFATLFVLIFNVCEAEQEQFVTSGDPRLRNKEIKKATTESGNTELLLTSAKDLNWQSSKSSCNDRLRHLYESKTLSDITIKLHDTNETIKTYKAHKLVLTMTSPLFEEQLKENSDSVLVIKDIDVLSFEKVLRYLYLNEIDFDDLDSAIRIAKAASNFQMKHLVDVSFKYMEEKYENDSLKRPEIIKQILDANLKDEIIDMFISLKYSDRLMTYSNYEDVKGFNENILNFVLEHSPGRNTFGLSKTEFMFNAVYEWAKARAGNPDSPESVREVMDDYLPKLDFLTMTWKEFTKVVMPTGLLTYGETAALGANLEQDKTLKIEGNIPKWCSLCYLDNSVFTSYRLNLDNTRLALNRNGLWKISIIAFGPSVYFYNIKFEINYDLDFVAKIFHKQRDVGTVSVRKSKTSSNLFEYIVSDPNGPIRFDDNSNQIDVEVALAESSVVPCGATVLGFSKPWNRIYEINELPSSRPISKFQHLKLNITHSGYSFKRIDLRVIRKHYLTT